MIVTLKWLGDFVDLKDTSIDKIVDKFINIGFEVEEVVDLAKGMERVTIGRIQKLSRHPNADKLQICSIDIGNGEMVQILTAATNVFEGALVPCALDGADLPNGTKINTTNMRGELSQGMLCSGEELVITDSVYPTASVDGIMILDESAVPGQNIAEFLGLDDVVLDIKVLANRPDCQSVMGLAKELAAGLNKEFLAKPSILESKAKALPLDVEIQTDKCPVYLAGMVRDTVIADSYQIIQRRLRAVGLKPKNNAVDLTNYLLWETGQPLHAFDYDKIKNHKIIVRNAVEGEKILALDDKEYILNSDMVVIADEEQPIGIAGVMGGKEFSISAETQNIVIESAVFDRVSIRRTARTLGLRTDASARFERGVETISAYNAMNAALRLASEQNMGQVCADVITKGKVNNEKREVLVKYCDFEKILGIKIALKDIVSILNALDISTIVSPCESEILCSVPAIRADITKTADIVEEVIRFYGFSHIVPTYCEKTESITGGMDNGLDAEFNLLNLALSTGAHQVRTYGFRSPVELDKLLLDTDDELRNVVSIQNPLSLDYSVMRTQMISSLLSVVAFNEAQQNFDIKICEIGKVFVNDRNENKRIPTENKMLAYMATGDIDFFDIKSIVELFASKLNTNFTYKKATKSFMHPNICAEIVQGNTVLGMIGKVHPMVTKNFSIKSDCYYFELNLSKLPAKKFKKIKALPKFPAALRDLAVLVDKDVPVGEMMTIIKKAGGNMLEEVELFDVYQGEQIEAGKKNVAFNLVFRKAEATMTQNEVNELFDKILAQLNKNFGATLRA